MWAMIPVAVLPAGNYSRKRTMLFNSIPGLTGRLEEEVFLTETGIFIRVLTGSGTSNIQAHMPEKAGV
jgi:hypothetical protein